MCFHFRFLLSLLAFLAVSATNATANPLGTTTEIQQYGITWTFAEPVQYGQFVNGDYYVVDPSGGVKVTNISPGYAMVGDRAVNGSMVNPTYNGQGYDSDTSSATMADYTESLNVGIGISASTPLKIFSGSSLVSSISNLDLRPNHTSRLKTAAVLTCLSSPPPLGSFRPGYSDPDKTMHNADRLNYSLLARLTPPDSAPSMASVEKKFQRVWLDHIADWQSRYLHPTENMPGGNYGREISRDIGIGALMLHLDFPDSEKEKLLISYIQLGIDLYGIVKAGGKNNWVPNGGIASGRKWPILFAGIMLDDPGMKAIGKKSGDYLYAKSYGPGNPPPDYIHFGEDGQTFYVRQFDVDITNGPGWKPDKRNAAHSPYTSAMLGMPEWAIRHSTKPKVSDASWTANYRQCCAPIAWAGFVLAARIMGPQALWNNPALFDFMDRYMAITAGQPDPFGFVVPGEVAGWRSWDTFTTDMWDRYRKEY